MRPFKLGIVSDGFRLSPVEGVRQAAALGADGVQIYTVTGEMSPENMRTDARRGFRDLCADLDLAIAALCGDLGGGFTDPATNPDKIERSKRIVDLAVDLGTAVVTTHIGHIPADPEDERYQTALAACRELAAYAAGKAVTFAVETGPESAMVLKGFLDYVDSPGLGVNLDPANFVMVTGDDPVEAVGVLQDYIVHTHAKDGVQTRPGDAAALFGAGAGPRPEFHETPLGEGGVDWDAYLDALEDIGYSGFLTIEREGGHDPRQNMTQAMEFLREKLR